MIEIKVIHEIHDVRQQHQADLHPQLVQFMEKVVAQLDDLMNVLTAVHDDVTAVLEKAKGLEAQLTQLQETTPPQVDLTAALAAATAIREQLEGTTSQTGDATGAAPAAIADDGSAGADLGNAADEAGSSDAGSASGADATTAEAGASASDAGPSSGDGSAGTADGGEAAGGGDTGSSALGDSGGGDASAGAGPDQGGPDAGASVEDGA